MRGSEQHVEDVEQEPVGPFRAQSDSVAGPAGWERKRVV